MTVTDESATATATDPDAARVDALIDQLLAENPPESTDDQAFLEAQYDLGLAWVRFPEGYGGIGVSPKLQRTVISRVNRAGGPVGGTLNPIGYGMCAPAVMEHGTDEQKRMLRALFSNEDIWCQLFSEPEAGSDLATLGTRAVLDGDEWIVNGQKVWNSSAQHADFGILICRTDPSVPKHNGITYFIVDMRTPGIEVRPLVQAQGVAHFNEVFFSDVRIPAANVVGTVNDGWKVTKTTMRSESSMISGAGQATTFVNVLATVRRCGKHTDPVVRQELAKVWSNEQILRYLSMRTQTAVMTGRRDLAIHGSLLKNFFTRSFTHRATLALDCEGAEGMLSGSDAEGDGFWQYQCINQFASKIGGGTEEVHRNNLAEQALGLPREPAADLGTPWNQLKRG